MNQLTLRRALPEDAEKIIHVTKQGFKQYAATVNDFESIKALHESLDDVLIDIKNNYVFVCEVDNELLGSLRIAVLEKGIAYLSRFAIHPKAQNLGLGGILLEKAKLECYSMGIKAITLYTASRMRSSVIFYLKNGYYIHSIDNSAAYLRAFMVNELTEMDEKFDYESIVNQH